MTSEPQPLVSIVLCTYNGERFLREQLDSLVRQDYPNLEIIALDDDSSDLSYEILKEYEHRFDFITAIKNPENMGYLRNFEKGISLCHGDYIAMSDQDDIWHTDKIS